MIPPKQLRVRPFTPTEAATTIPAVVTDPASREQVVAAAGANPANVLVAFDGAVPKAIGVGAFTALGYRLLALHPARDAGEPALVGLLEHVGRWFAGARVEATTEDETLDAPLRAAGFAVIEDRVHYERPLAGDEPLSGAEPGHIRYRTVERLSRADLVAIVAPMLSPVNLDGSALSAADRADTMLFLAQRGDQLDTSQWRLAFAGSRLAGVSCAQVLPVVDDTAPDGTLLFVGVAPHARNTGLGTLIHRDALERLRAAGARRYVDQTTSDNTAMRRVFERNGCSLTGRSRLWLRGRPAELPTRIDDFGELVDYLRIAGHEVEVRNDGGWVHASVMCGRIPSAIDFVWARDLGLLQVIHTFPFDVDPTVVESVVRATTEINARVDIPGFVFHTSSRTLRFQLPVLLDQRGGVTGSHLRAALRVVVRTSARSWTWWRNLVQADATARETAADLGRMWLE